MTRVVFDTNIVVSAALRANGNEAKAFRVVVDGRAVLYATPIILAEYEGVLLRPALRLDVPKVRGLLEAITAVAVVVDAVVRVDASPDEADNRFLDVCGDGWRRFSRNWKSQGLSEFLACHEDRQRPRVPRSDRRGLRSADACRLEVHGKRRCWRGPIQ